MGVPELAIWERMSQAAFAYYEKHQKKIQEQERERVAAEIVKVLPATLAKGHVVWCRSGEVCSEATLCGTLCCEHKNLPDDIVFGASKCQRFQVTRLSQRGWYDAVHVDVHGELMSH